MRKLILYGLLWPASAVLWCGVAALTVVAVTAALPAAGLAYLYAAATERIDRLAHPRRTAAVPRQVRLGVDWAADGVDYDAEWADLRAELKKSKAERTPLATERHGGVDPAAGPDRTVTAVRTADGWQARADSTPRGDVVQAGVEPFHRVFVRVPTGGVVVGTVADVATGDRFRLAAGESSVLATSRSGWWRCVRGVYTESGRQFVDCLWEAT